MKFVTRKRRTAPGVIIVSLIDILIVVLIFLMVSTTFRSQPAIKLTLPESSQERPGEKENPPLIVTIAKQAPFLYLGELPVTLEKLKEELVAHAKKNPNVVLAIRADSEAPTGQVVKVMDA